MVRAAFQRFLPKGRFGRGVAALVGGTAAGQSIAVIASPLLTRLYTPADFGALGVFTSLIGILSVVACLRFDLAIPLPASDEDAANLAALALSSTVVVTALTALVTTLFGERLVTLTNTLGLAHYLWLLPVGVLAIGTYLTLNYWTIRTRQYPRIARASLIQGVSSVGVQLAGAVVEGPLGLLLGQVTVHAAGGTTLAVPIWRAQRDAFRKVSVRRMRKLAYRYRAFPLVQSWSSLLNVTGLRLPPLLLAALFGAPTAGLFALGTRVIASPVTLIGTSVSQVYVGEQARLIARDPRAAERLFLTTARRLLLWAAGPMVLIGLASPWVFAALFGQSWRAAGVLVQALAIMYLMQIVVSPISQTLVLLERQRLQITWDAGRVILTVAALWLPQRAGLGITATITVYGVAMAVAYLVHFVLMWGALRQRCAASDAADPDIRADG